MTGKQFFYIVVITFITLMVWVVLNIIHSNSEVKIPDKVQQLIEPIDPNFDQSAIDKL